LKLIATVKQPRDNVTIIALYLLNEGPNIDNEVSLLEPDINHFRSNIRDIVPFISQQLATTIEALKALTEQAPSSGDTARSSKEMLLSHQGVASVPGCFAARPDSKHLTPCLSSRISDRQARLRTLHLHELPALREKLAATAAKALTCRSDMMEQMIILLERTKHGALARATRTQVEHLATVAEGVEAKVQYVNRSFTDFKRYRFREVKAKKKETKRKEKKRKAGEKGKIKGGKGV
jgi:diphthamide biosynthesis protein 3